jgi:hypothetical protein
MPLPGPERISQIVGDDWSRLRLLTIGRDAIVSGADLVVKTLIRLRAVSVPTLGGIAFSQSGRRGMKFKRGEGQYDQTLRVP